MIRRRWVALALVIAGVVATVAVALVVLDYVADPPTASCNAPTPSFSSPARVLSHQEVVVHYACEGAVQAGTLYLPSSAGPHPAVIWVHAAGPQIRLRFGDFVGSLVDAGVAVFSYDKRGTGESQGSCCPGDGGHFNLLSADVAGAVAAIASRSDVTKDEIGLIGASQAGWIAPKAASLSGHVAFIALASATPLTERLTNLYERLAGGAEGQLSKNEISRRLASAGPSGFDPLPFWRQITAPSFWMFGTADDRVPVPESVALLDQLKKEGRNVEYVIFQGAGHGLLDAPPTDANAAPTIVNWILKRVRVPNS